MERTERQLELEQEYSHNSIALGIQAMQKAVEEGRVSDTGAGQKLISAAHSTVVEYLTATIEARTRGVGGKYRALLRTVPVEVLAVIGLRVCLNKAANHQQNNIAAVLHSVGNAVESETVVQKIAQHNPVYLKRTTEYLDKGKTKSERHRIRTFEAACENLEIPHTDWSQDDKVGVGRLVVEAVFNTGLFRWAGSEEVQGLRGRKTYKGTVYLHATPELAASLQEAVQFARAMVHRPPMLVQPMPWTTAHAGGYLTEWMQVRSPRIHLPSSFPSHARAWLKENLQAPAAQTLRDVANKTQNVPYRVNAAVANLLQRVLAEGGTMGVPLRTGKEPPEFPHGDNWDKDQASPTELEVFADWKSRMSMYYTDECLRVDKLRAVASAARELMKYVGDTIYFPTFLDSRGRMYFSPDLNPQSHDFVKAGLEFAEGKPLGARGLYWLKVHVATCAGFDKHDFPLRAKWTEDNHEFLKQYLHDPMNTPAPDPDQCWVLYAATRSYFQALALPNPEAYVCHTPVAMDATCSGLQHWSAILRDSSGGKFTNLFDSGGDRKQDIYAAVAEKAVSSPVFASAPELVQRYWQDLGISRTMAKRPVMTYVYGAKLIGAVDYLFQEMIQAGAKPVLDTNGDVLYGLNSLAVTGAKSLREAVEATVPSASEGMRYLQNCIKNTAVPLRWITPVGMPVFNWTPFTEDRRVQIRSMGVTCILFRHSTDKYNKMKAANSISPNFIHSYDAAHMFKTIAAFKGHIVPIHDSFATHPSDVDELHDVVRSAFLGLYLHTEPLNTLQEVDYEENVPPVKGDLKLTKVLESRFFIC